MEYLFMAKTKQNYTFFCEPYWTIRTRGSAAKKHLISILGLMLICLLICLSITQIALDNTFDFIDILCFPMWIAVAIPVTYFILQAQIHAWKRVRKLGLNSKCDAKYLWLYFYNDYLEVHSDTTGRIHKYSYADLVGVTETKHYYLFFLEEDGADKVCVMAEKNGFEIGEATQAYEFVYKKLRKRYNL